MAYAIGTDSAGNVVLPGKIVSSDTNPAAWAATVSTGGAVTTSLYTAGARFWTDGVSRYRLLGAAAPADVGMPTTSVVSAGKTWPILAYQGYNTAQVTDAVNIETTTPYSTQVSLIDASARGIKGFDGFGDTSKVGIYSKYAPTVTVHNSELDIKCFYDGSLTRVACILPFGYTGQIGGRWSWKMRTTQNTTNLQYKIVPLLWSARDVWADGELDQPENRIGSATSDIQINWHETTGSPQVSHGTTATGKYVSDSHVYTLEWIPPTSVGGTGGLLNFLIDGVLARTTTNGLVIPYNAMRFEIQAEVLDLSGATIPPATDVGHVYIDWFVQWGPGV